MSHNDHPLDRLIRKMSVHAPLSDDDCAAIRALPHQLRTLEPARYFIREGDAPRQCAVLLSGYTYRQKLTGAGDRQIVALNVPGDPVDFQGLFLAFSDHNVQALTRVEIATIPRSAMQDLIRTNAVIASAVIATILVETAIGREWLLNIGRRDARGRLAHFLCEFALRVDAQGLKSAEGYELPMTQEQLGDALGLTSVHVNRTLKVLETEGALRREGRRIVFDRWDMIRDIADFSALYLHLGEP